LIKRVIALPGERIVIKDGKVTVYNDSHPEGFDPDETLGIKDTILGETLDNEDKIIGDGEIYVMGDHRNNSMDSRAFGPISTTDIVGTLSARILPLSQAKKF
jgi:signal peptidase I